MAGSRWRVVYVFLGSDEYDRLTAAGWEPFGASPTSAGEHFVYLRRQQAATYNSTAQMVSSFEQSADYFGTLAALPWWRRIGHPRRATLEAMAEHYQDAARSTADGR